MIGDCGSLSFVMKRPMIVRRSVLGCSVIAGGMVGLGVDKVPLVGVEGW